MKLRNKTKYPHAIGIQTVRASRYVMVEDGTDYDEKYFEEINGTDTGAKLISKPGTTKTKTKIKMEDDLNDSRNS